MNATARSVVIVTALTALAVLGSCAPARTTTRSAPMTPVAEPAPVTPKRPAFLGPWATLRKEFEIRGFNAMGLGGSDLVIYLVRTHWEEMDMGVATTREGYAEIEVETDSGRKTLRIDKGDHAVFDGYDIAVTDVGDAVSDTGRDIPDAKFIVTVVR